LRPMDRLSTNGRSRTSSIPGVLATTRGLPARVPPIGPTPMPCSRIRETIRSSFPRGIRTPW
jgi:hypothetical protein